MAVVVKCRSCRKLIKDQAAPCPACGSVERKFFVRYYPEGRNAKRSWYPLDDVITTIEQARIFDEALRVAALEGRKPGSVRENLTAATVKDLTPDYLSWVKLHYTKQTHREREYTMTYIHKIIGDVPVMALNDHHFSLYQSTRIAQGVSGRTVNKELNYVRGFARWCRDEKKLAVRELKMKALPEPRPLPIVLSPDEVTKFLEVADPFYRAFFLCLYTMGLRFTEAQQIKWGDVDFANKVCRAQQKGRTFKLLPINDRLISALKAIGPPLDVNGDPIMDSYVFISKRTGRPIVNVRKSIRSICKSAGITKSVYPHLFRHSAACNMMTSGTNLRTIQQMLGHADIESTTWYTHVALGHLREASDSIEKGMNKASGDGLKSTNP